MIQVKDHTETDFKDTEIGAIPADWEIAKLRDVVRFTHKPRNLRLADFEAIPFIPMDLIPDEGVYAEKYLPRSSQEITSGTYYEDGDLLVAKITPSFENGKQAIVRGSPLKFGYATTEVFAIQTRPQRLEKLFLFDFLKQPHVRADIASRMEGTTGRQRVPKTVLENYLLPLPPLPEQQRIAAVLNAIQDAIAVQDDIIAEAREFKRSLMHRLFTYGASSEPVETKETEIGEIPTHWRVAELGTLLDGTQYGLNERAEASGLYPVLRMNNLVDGKITINDLKYVNLDTNSLARYRLKDGDILFNRTNSYELVGKTSLFGLEGDFVFASYLVRVETIGDKLLSPFLAYYMNSEEVQARLRQLATRGVSQSNISPTKLKTLMIAYPPSTSEQGEIVATLRKLDGKLAIEGDRKTALQDLFKTMLYQLMTGQIRLLTDKGLPL
jgi:type I restriction enzyme S subunit